MASKKQVIKRLAELGMAFATRTDKYTDPSDPFGAQQRGEKTYHIHPDRSYPAETAIKRFRTLQEILDFCEATERARDFASHCEYEAAEQVMSDFWAAVER